MSAAGEAIEASKRPGKWVTSRDFTALDAEIGRLQIDVARLKQENSELASDLRLYLGYAERDKARIEALEKSWLCYHCGVRFTDGEAASRHFGTATNDVPLCQADKMLIVRARKERDEYAEIRATLLTKVDALRAALKPFAASAYDRDDMPAEWEIRVPLSLMRQARAALGAEQLAGNPDEGLPTHEDVRGILRSPPGEQSPGK